MSTALVVLVFLLALAAGAGIFFFVSGSGQQRLAKRVKRRFSADRALTPVRQGPSLRRDRQAGLDRLIQRLMPRPAAFQARLAATGSGMTAARYGLISVAVAVGVAGLCMIRGLAPLGGVLVGVLAGLAAPHMLVGFLIKRRKNRFIKLFPEAIGLMVRGLKAGLPITESMNVVGREVANPVGEEFRRVGELVRLGQAVEDSMWSTAKRLSLPEFNFLVITLSVQRETGGNLAETLENLDDVLRKRQQMRLKVKAMSSEAVASAGIIGSLPFVMTALMYFVQPAYIMTLFQSTLGYILLAAGGTSMVIGIIVMAKMVSFEL